MLCSNRREFLRQLSLGTGGILFSPLTQPLPAASAAGAATPKRFVFVTISNGLSPRSLQPNEVAKERQPASRLIDLPLREMKLPTTLEPLEPFKERMTILQGLSNRIASGGHFTEHGALGAYSARVGAFAETIDLALAKTRGTIFPHLGLGIVTHDSPIAYGRSAAGREQPVASVCQPELAYNQLFGNVGDGEARQALTARDNLIDFLARDLKKFDARLTGEERRKLDVQAQGFQAMIARRDRLDAIRGSLKQHAPVIDANYTAACPMERLKAQFDLGAAALISGLTDVLTISSGVGGNWNMTFKSLGITIGSHTLHHGGSENGRSSNELAEIVRRHHVEQLAGLARKLQAVPEGQGTMLDNTVLMFLSDNGQGHHSDCSEFPFVVLGNLGGRLKTNGRYLEYPRHGQPGQRTAASWYVTLLEAAGSSRASFGVPDPTVNPNDQKGPLPELLA